MITNPISFDLIFEFIDKILNLGVTVWNFLFTTIEVLDYRFSVFSLLGGTLLVTLTLLLIVKAVTPLL